MREYTLQDMQRDFPDEATCLHWLFTDRFSEDFTCPKCGMYNAKYHRMVSRKSYSCQNCGHHLHPTADTIFHKSSTPLNVWFHGVYLVASSTEKISAKQLERELGVTYKTAWRIATLIRAMLYEDDAAP
jgi:transposase